jgi:epidermal growth factor receptor substrate 15
LPFPSEHDESISSSRQVSAPNSRFGEGSTSAETPTNYLGATPTGSSPAGGQPEVAREASPGLDRKSTASPTGNGATKEAIPGAFPGDSNSDIIATPTGGTTLSEQAAADPFVTKGVTRSATTKEDFDAAFAGFGGSAKPQERSNTGSSSNEGSNAALPSSFNKEFPPIAELDHDEESESGSEGGGFDDDFAPVSPERNKQVNSGKQAAATTANGTSSLLGAQVSKGIGENPPTPGAQASPPAYNKAVSPNEQAQAEVQQFSGLLPEREDPSSVHALGASKPAGGVPTSSQPVPAAKVPFDDEFDEFDDLEDAKEGDADDDFANISVHDRSGLDDFNPMFDSPRSKAPEHLAQGSSGFTRSTGFGDFTQSPVQTSPPPAASNTTVNDSHDWDAIFAGLDSPTAVATSEPAKPLGNGTTTAAATKDRPALGRALTETGVHDDPILKNLTGMGYTRSDALAALEKYDYNLERVSSIHGR